MTTHTDPDLALTALLFFLHFYLFDPSFKLGTFDPDFFFAGLALHPKVHPRPRDHKGISSTGMVLLQSDPIPDIDLLRLIHLYFLLLNYCYLHK